MTTLVGFHGGAGEAPERHTTTPELVEPDPREADGPAPSYRRFRTGLHERGWIDDELYAAATS